MESNNDYIRVKKITKPSYYLVGSDKGVLVSKNGVVMINRLLEVLNQEVIEIKKQCDERIAGVKKPILSFIREKYKVNFDSEQEELIKFDVKAEQEKLEEIRQKMKKLGIDTSMDFTEFTDLMSLFGAKK